MFQLAKGVNVSYYYASNDEGSITGNFALTYLTYSFLFLAFLSLNLCGLYRYAKMISCFTDTLFLMKVLAVVSCVFTVIGISVLFTPWGPYAYVFSLLWHIFLEFGLNVNLIKTSIRILCAPDNDYGDDDRRSNASKIEFSNLTRTMISCLSLLTVIDIILICSIPIGVKFFPDEYVVAVDITENVATLHVWLLFQLLTAFSRCIKKTREKIKKIQHVTELSEVPFQLDDAEIPRSEIPRKHSLASSSNSHIQSRKSIPS